MHPISDRVNRVGHRVLLYLGAASIAFALFEASFSSFRLTEHILRRLHIVMKDEVLGSPNYIYERWLVIAIVTTIVLNMILYFSNFLTAFVRILARRHEEWRIFVVLFGLTVFPIFFWWIGVSWPWQSLKEYYLTPGSMHDLKDMIGILLVLFVAYDFIMVGTIWLLRSPATSLRREEAWIALIRIDAPILFAFFILYIFTDGWPDFLAYVRWAAAATDGAAPKAIEETLRLNTDAFNAGAAAFKLIISNFLYTVMLLEATLTKSTFESTSDPLARPALAKKRRSRPNK